MAYDRKFKEEVLDAVANGMSAPEAALKYNVSEQAIRNWRSEDPEQYGNDKRKPIRTYDLKEKLDLINLVSTSTAGLWVAAMIWIPAAHPS